MTTPAHADAAPVAPHDAIAQALDALRQRGAAARLPLRLHFAESLARRIDDQQGQAKVLLEQRLMAALSDMQAQLETPTSTSTHTPTSTPVAAPAAAPQDVALRPTLADLTRLLSHGLDAGATPVASEHATQTHELKAVRTHRSTWQQLSADQHLKAALGRAPRNAGPINSHRLVLQSLTLMRDIAPDYLRRFMAYADALLCLDAAGKEVAAPSGKAAVAAASRTASASRTGRTPAARKPRPRPETPKKET